MKDIPYMTVGADELDDDEMVDATIVCPKCGSLHTVENSTPPTLQYYVCKDKTYLCGINGRKIGGMNGR